VTCNDATTVVTVQKLATDATNPAAPTLGSTCVGTSDGVVLGSAFEEFYFGDSWKPRVAVGIGFNWNSPFGPFRIDFAKTLLKQPGDSTKSFTFNVGTQF
jgi:outer membrane protein insertion porin family